MAFGKRWLLLCMVFFATLSSPKVIAQENLPSLEKTIEWLRPNITNSLVMNEKLSGKKSSKQKVIEWSLGNPSRCVLVWKGWKPEDRVGRGAAMVVSVEINLAEFDPKRINTGRLIFSDGKRTNTFWTVFLETTDKKSVINWRGSNESFYSSSISFRFNDEQLADGVIRAFQRAINLCGGKSSPNKPDPFLRKNGNSLPLRY